MRFKKDVELDAAMCYAGMRGMLEPFCIGRGISPSDMVARTLWVRKQSKQYINQIVMRVKKMEIDKLKKDIK